MKELADMAGCQRYMRLSRSSSLVLNPNGLLDLQFSRDPRASYKMEHSAPQPSQRYSFATITTAHEH